MNFENSNRLYELAADNPVLAEKMEELYRSYSSKMHEYILELAHRYGVELESDCFEYSSDSKLNFYRQQRLKIAGLILNKKPEEYLKFMEFSRKVDADYAEEKIKLAKTYGIDLTQEEAEALSMWTGIL